MARSLPAMQETQIRPLGWEDLLKKGMATHSSILGTSLSSVQFSSVAQSCPTLCDPVNHSTPGLPVHYQLPEFTQTHAHRVSDAIQPSHPLSSPSPPAPNPSQHQGLFQQVSSSREWIRIQNAKTLLQYQTSWMSHLLILRPWKMFSNS